MTSKGKLIKKKPKHRSESSLSMDDYCLDRLFDPEELYYTPMDVLLKRYSKRNLRPGRVFNLAKKYGHIADDRVRKIQAPQMLKAGQRIFGTENFYFPPPKTYFCSEPNGPKTKPKTEEKKELKGDSSSSSDEDSSENRLSYADRLKARKSLRENLNQLDLDDKYLKRKADLTTMEKRVLYKITHIDKMIQTDPIIEKKPKRTKHSVTPIINYPTPRAMEKIEQFLEDNKWRLVDLFKGLDKDKDWKIYKSDFLREFRKGKLDTNEIMTDELVFALGTTKRNRLKYSSLSKGRDSFKLEKRNELKKESIRTDDEVPSYMRAKDSSRKRSKSREKSASTSTKEGSNRVKNSAMAEIRISSAESFSERRKKQTPISRISNNSSISNSGNYLKLPRINVEPGSFPYTPDIKQIPLNERGISAASTIGLKSTSPIIQKPRPSAAKSGDIKTETVESLSEFRSKCQSEYEKCLLRVDMNILKSKDSLKQALILPADRPKEEIIKSLELKSRFKSVK